VWKAARLNAFRLSAYHRCSYGFKEAHSSSAVAQSFRVFIAGQGLYCLLSGLTALNRQQLLFYCPLYMQTKTERGRKTGITYRRPLWTTPWDTIQNTTMVKTINMGMKHIR